MIRKYIYIFLLAEIIATPLLAQLDYYATDSSTVFGVKLVDRGAYLNSRQCEIQNEDKSVILGPDKVKEYSLSKGRVYVRKTVLINSVPTGVFLERMISGKITLYFYKGEHGRKFYLVKDTSGLIEISKKDELGNIAFPENITKYISDYDTAILTLTRVSYTKSSLGSFIRGYNYCSLKPLKPILLTQFGILLGMEKVGLIQNSQVNEPYLDKVRFTQDYNVLFGLFLDIPIHQSNFSFHPEIYVNKNGFSAHFENTTTIADFVINTTSINLPVLVRYSLPISRFKPYLNLGFRLTGNIKNSNKVYRGSKNQNVIVFESGMDIPLLPAFQSGSIIGGGAQYKLNNRKSIFLEIRYGRLYGGSDPTLGISSIQLFTGINL